MRAVTEARGLVDIAPVYQLTVLAAVALTSAVAVAKGGPETRCAAWVGLTSKKSCAAWMADAAVSWVAAKVRIELVSAAWRLAAVAAGVAPMVKESTTGGDAVVAFRVNCWVVPSGRLKVRSSSSPGLG